MRFSSVSTALAGLCFSASALGLPTNQSDPNEVLKDLRAKALAALAEKPASHGCSLETARRRRDWEAFSKCQKKEYIRAVNCLWDMPARSDPALAPAQNHFDDFVAIHLNLTNFVHQTGNFLSYHRNFVYNWETTLRDECHYKGDMPYWNWFKYTDDISKSPVFDGSDTSMGGNGAYRKHNGSLGAAGTVWLPSGEGGGCVESGPFVNRTIVLGPIAPGMQDFEPLMESSQDKNGPRCIYRDFTNEATIEFDSTQLLNLTVGEASQSIGLFQTQLQANTWNQKLGLHGAGHYGVGGDMSDPFSSPNDPVFYFHHSMLDQIWWIWQALHPEMASDLSGTRTYRNDPPSPNTTLNETLHMGATGPSRPLYQMMDTLGGSPLCYIYE